MPMLDNKLIFQIIADKMMEIENMPEFMRDVAIAIARRYNVAVERLTKLSSQGEEKQLRLVTQYLNLTQN